MENQVTLNVTPDQLNFMLNCLAKTPYEVSAGLIQSLISQAQPQIAEMQQNEPPAEETMQ
jgi:hypothetical protein